MLTRKIFFFFIVASIFVSINARSLNLSQKELKNVGSAINSALRIHVLNNDGYKIFGVFKIESKAENPDDFDITLELDLNSSETINGILSGECDKIFSKIFFNFTIFSQRQRRIKWFG